MLATLVCLCLGTTALLRQPRRADHGLAVLAPIVEERMHMEGPEPAGLALVAQ